MIPDTFEHKHPLTSDSTALREVARAARIDIEAAIFVIERADRIRAGIAELWRPGDLVYIPMACREGIKDAPRHGSIERIDGAEAVVIGEAKSGWGVRFRMKIEHLRPRTGNIERLDLFNFTPSIEEDETDPE